MMYGAVGANTNSSYGKMYRRTTKIALTLSKAMEEQFTHLICLTYQGKQNCSVVSTNNQCMEQLEQKQILSMPKCMGRTANSL